MRAEIRRTTSETRTIQFRETDSFGNTGFNDFLQPHYIRKPAPVRPRTIDSLRAGGRRFDDCSRRCVSENTWDIDPMKHKCSMTFAWIAVLAAWIAGIVIVAIIRDLNIF